MGNIRKKRPYEGPILNIHKMYYRLSLNKSKQDIWHTLRESYGL